MRPRNARKPTRRCLIRAASVIAISLTLALVGTWESFAILRTIGILFSVYGCTYLISTRTNLHADVLDREFGRGYDAGYADGLTARYEAVEESARIASVVVPFDRAAQ